MLEMKAYHEPWVSVEIDRPWHFVVQSEAWSEEEGVTECTVLDNNIDQQRIYRDV